jgi:hypothetical protein
MNPLLNAKAELDKLLEQEIEIHRKLDAVKQTIKLLEPFYGRDAELEASGLSLAEILAQDELGITEAVEQTLIAHANRALYPTDVRDLMEISGFEVRGDNPMATIHTILKRLVAKRGRVVMVKDDSGKAMYKYILPATFAENLAKQFMKAREK